MAAPFNEPVLVVGAGLAGLTCALDLERSGVPVRLLEAGPRAGGVVGTHVIDGYRFERGPTSVPGSATAFRELCADAGVADDLVVSRAEAKHRFLYHAGRLQELPTSPLGLLTTPLLSLRGKLALLSEPLRKRLRIDSEREPDLAAFLDERLGKEAARRLGGAFVRGVYAAELSELGARSAFPRLWSLVAEHGSLVRGALRGKRGEARGDGPAPGPATARGDLISFPGGMQHLLDALVERLGASLRTGAEVTSIARTEAGGWRVRLADGGELAGSALVLACPASVAYRLLAEHLGADVPVHHLRQVRHADLCVVHLGLERAAVPELPTGFGFLVPPDEEEPAPEALGVVFASDIFPGRAPAGRVALTAFYKSQDLAGTDEEVARFAAADLALALGRDAAPEPEVSAVDRWTDVIPRFSVGHADRIAELEQAVRRDLPGLHLAGCWVRGVSVEQVILSGRDAARDVRAGARQEVAT